MPYTAERRPAGGGVPEVIAATKVSVADRRPCRMSGCRATTPCSPGFGLTGRAGVTIVWSCHRRTWR